MDQKLSISEILTGRLAQTFATFLLGLAIIAMLLTPHLVAWWSGGKSFAELGAFGDQFGVATAFFSALAFLGIIGTLLLQIVQLDMQQKELRETKNAAAEQKIEIVAQADARQIQMFENVFFNLLSLQHEIVGGIRLQMAGNWYEGRSALIKLTDQFRVLIRVQSRREDSANRLGNIQKHYDNQRRIHVMNDIDHYFQNIFEIMIFITNSNIENIERYSRLLRSQFSHQELVLIYYNCICKNWKAFACVAQEVSFFENMPSDQLFEEKDRDCFQRVLHSN